MRVCVVNDSLKRNSVLLFLYYNLSNIPYLQKRNHINMVLMNSIILDIFCSINKLLYSRHHISSRYFQCWFTCNIINKWLYLCRWCYVFETREIYRTCLWTLLWSIKIQYSRFSWNNMFFFTLLALRHPQKTNKLTFYLLGTITILSQWRYLPHLLFYWFVLYHIRTKVFFFCNRHNKTNKTY